MDSQLMGRILHLWRANSQVSLVVICCRVRQAISWGCTSAGVSISCLAQDKLQKLIYVSLKAARSVQLNCGQIYCFTGISVCWVEEKSMEGTDLISYCLCKICGYEQSIAVNGTRSLERIVCAYSPGPVIVICVDKSSVNSCEVQPNTIRWFATF